MRHVPGFSNSTRIRYIVNGFGMYGTINDIYTKTATVNWLTIAVTVVFGEKVAQWVLVSPTKESKCKLI